MRLIGVSAVLMLLSLTMMAAEPISIGSAQSDFAAGQYTSCLQKISALLGGNNAPPGSVQRYDLLMLRGECMLRLKSSSLASDAFMAASHVSGREGDVQRVCGARALSVLAMSSPGQQYNDKQSGEEMDILTPDGRTKAMEALFADRLAELSPKIDAAAKSDSLAPSHDLLPALGDLYCLEVASTGKAERTLPAIHRLGDHARSLITAELTRISARVETLNDLATEPTINNSLPRSIGYRGLTSPERTELQGLAKTLVDIQRVSQEGRRINRRLGGDGSAWDAILGQCDDIKDRAQKAYDRRY